MPLDTPSIKASLGINAKRAGKVVRDPATSDILRGASLAGRYEQAVLADKEERRREKQLKEAQRKDRP